MYYKLTSCIGHRPIDEEILTSNGKGLDYFFQDIDDYFTLEILSNLVEGLHSYGYEEYLLMFDIGLGGMQYMGHENELFLVCK